MIKLDVFLYPQHNFELKKTGINNIFITVNNKSVCIK
jgi:hypothetical protein